MIEKFILILVLFTSACWVRADVSLDVVGGDAALKENLLARLRLAVEDCRAPSWRVRRLFKDAEKDLVPALRAFGFYRSDIKKTLQTNDDCWQAGFVITPGKAVVIRERVVEVDGEAQQDKAMKTLLGKLPLSPGETLHHGRYEDIKSQLKDFAAERGYFDFEITRSELRVNPDEAWADIRIQAQSGPRYRFGELHLSDEHRLDDAFLRNLAKIKENEPYSARALAALDRELSDAGYFRRVEVRALRDERSDGKVPIDIVLEPKPRHAWRMGIGFSTDTGPRGSLRYENREINRHGHRAQAELRLSPKESGLSADYFIPGPAPHRRNYSFGAGLLHEDNDSVLSDSFSLIGRQIVKSERWNQTRLLKLLHERSNVGGQRIQSTLLMPAVELERVKADDILRTRRGYRVSLEVRGAYEGLISDAIFVQLQGSAKGIYRFGKGGRLTGRLDAGLTLGDSVLDLPASIRFFAGGDNSVRGYGYKALGPRDADGDVVGGHHLLTGSIEYEHPVAGDDWWVAAFADVGNAFDSESIELKAGYGVGIRWYSPVGRLRIDLAFPDDTRDDTWRLHFGLGADL